MTRHLVVLVALLFVAESHSMGFKRRKLQSGSEAGAPRELRRAEGKGAGKRSGDDAPAATAAGAGSTAPAVPAAAASAASSAAATACCWLFNDQTKRYQFYPKPATATCQAPYKLAACPKPKDAPAPAASPPPPPPVAVEAPPREAAPVAAPAAQEAPPAKRKFNKPSAVEADEPATPSKKEQRAEARADAAAGQAPPQRIPAADKMKAEVTSSGGGGGGFGTFIFVAGLAGIGYAFRGKIRAALADYFPSGDRGAAARSLGSCGRACPGLRPRPPRGRRHAPGAERARGRS